MPTGYLEARFESSGPLNESGTGPYSSAQKYFPVLSFRPSLGVSHLMRDDELRNVDEPLQVLSESKDPSWDLEMRAYPDTLAFLLSLALGTPATTAGSGTTVTDLFGTVVAGGAYRHRWTAPFGPSGASPYSATFRVSYSDQSTYFTMRGAGCQSVSIASPETGGVRISASGPALFLGTAPTHGLSPSYEALTIAPFMRSHLSIPSWLAAGATSVEDFAVSISNPQEAYHSLATASQYPDQLEKANAGPVTITGSIPKRQLDNDDIAALLAATAFSGSARWNSQSTIGTTTTTYKMNMAFDSLQYTDGGPGALANVRRIGSDLSFKATYDGSGSSVIIEVVNATASYA